MLIALAETQLGAGSGFEPAGDAQRRRGTARRRASASHPRPRPRPDERALAATLRDGRRVSLLVAPWGEPLDPHWREPPRTQSSARAPWCLLFNGTHLRLVDAGRLYTRRYLEFDVDLTLDDPRDLCRVLVAHARRTRCTSSSRPPTAMPSASADRSSRRACRLGRRAFGPGRTDAADGSGTGRRLRAGAHDRVSHSLSAVRGSARAGSCLASGLPRELQRRGAPRGGRAPAAAAGLWDALRAIARLAHAGCRAGDLRVTPFNGRLFAPARTPLAERRDLDDEAARRAVLALSTRPSPDRAGRERIAYRDLGVEQLGAVYETLLDYRPAVASRPAVDPTADASSSGRIREHARPPARSTRPSRSPTTSSAGRSDRWCATPSPNASSSSASSIRRWAAERSWSPRAAIWRRRTKRRSSGPAATTPAISASASARGDPADDCRAVSVRRRPEPDGRPAGAAVALAGDARRRSAAQVSRSPSAGRRQPAGRVACRPSPRAAGDSARRASDDREPLLFDDWRVRDVCARSCRSGSRSSRRPTTPSIRCARRNGRSPR